MRPAICAPTRMIRYAFPWIRTLFMVFHKYNRLFMGFQAYSPLLVCFIGCDPTFMCFNGRGSLFTCFNEQDSLLTIMVENKRISYISEIVEEPDADPRILQNAIRTPTHTTVRLSDERRLSQSKASRLVTGKPFIQHSHRMLKTEEFIDESIQRDNGANR